MRNMIPCPSPNGTNHERLFIVRAPKLALDAAMDPDNDAQADAVPWSPRVAKPTALALDARTDVSPASGR